MSDSDDIPISTGSASMIEHKPEPDPERESAPEPKPEPEQEQDPEQERRRRDRPESECCADQPLATRIESLLISSDRPLGDARIAALLGIPTKGAAASVRESVETLNKLYEKSKRSFRIERLAGGWQLLTIEAFGPLLTRLHQQRQQSRLSQAALETLSIIGYRQPVMRAEVEAIRGVACGEVLRGLLERRLVKIVGRAEELGRPMLYGTTKEFLNVFGLAGLEDLPEVEGLSREASTALRPPAAVPAPETAPAAEAVEPDASDTEPSFPEEEAKA